jgi:hypothetical protein
LKNLGGDGGGSNLIVPISNVCAIAQRNSDNVLSQYHVLKIMFVAIDPRVRKRFQCGVMCYDKIFSGVFFHRANRAKFTRGRDRRQINFPNVLQALTEATRGRMSMGEGQYVKPRYEQ